jgi:hypothetical protein
MEWRWYCRVKWVAGGVTGSVAIKSIINQEQRTQTVGIGLLAVAYVTEMHCDYS